MKRSISEVSMVIVVALMALVMLSAAFTAFAQEANPCAKDFAKFCSHVTPGGGRLVRCYEQYKDSMSAACRAWAEGAKINAAALKEACSKEIDARCNVEKGDPLAMLSCLQGNYVSLSPECISALNKFKWRYTLPAQ